MSDGNDPEQVSGNGFGAVENGIMEGYDSDGKLINMPNSNCIPITIGEEERNGVAVSESNGIEVPENQLSADNQELDLNRNNISDESNDAKVTEDGGKEDMFVDAPDELNVYDGKLVYSRELLATLGSREGLDDINNDERETLSRENGTHVQTVADEVENLRALLENAVDEKDRIVRECKEERQTFTEEVSKLLQQLKALTEDQSFVLESNAGLADLIKAETGGVAGKAEVSNSTSLDLVNECSEFLKRAVAERSQTEGAIRELHAVLFMKDEEIENLNSKVMELSVSRDVVDSYLGSAQETWTNSLEAKVEKERDIGIVADRMLASLGVNIDQQLEDQSVTGKLYHLEKMTYMLIENYNAFFAESSQLRQKELELVAKLSYLEDENKKVIGQLEKSKEVAEMKTAEVTNIKVELEQEKSRSANVREKLTMAVTKGKALVQQRDSLRQSLADKTSELDQCISEMQEKASALEAAELCKGELVKSENLVASLQDSLLQRNVVVKKFEEILSQIAIPEGLQLADSMDRLRWIIESRTELAHVSLELYNIRESLSSIDVPEELSSSTLEAQVKWLGESFYWTKEELYRIKNDVDQMRESANVEIDHLTAALSAEVQERVYLQKQLEELTREREEMVEQAHQVSVEKDQMMRILIEASGDSMDDQGVVYQPPSDVTLLVEGCLQRIKEQCVASSKSSNFDAEAFESFKTLLYIRDQELAMSEILLEEEVNYLSTKLEVTSREFLAVKDEKNSLMKDFEKCEEKSALLREKLSMAVKKGKGLVQERENLKAVLEEKKTEIEKLRSEVQKQESALDDCKKHVLKLSNDVESIPKLEADLVDMKDQRNQLEQHVVEINNILQKVGESVGGVFLPVDSVNENPLEKIKWLAGHFSECHFAKAHAEEELGRVKEEASNLASILTEAKSTINSLEDSLSVSQGNVSKLAEERRELQDSKTHLEQRFQQAIEEANTHAEEELGRIKEEISSLGSKLAEANRTIDSLEVALSVSENKVCKLEEERRELEAGKADLEQNLQKSVDEARSESVRMVELSVVKKSLEDALSLAGDNISALSSEKKNAQAGRAAAEMELENLKQEISMHTTKLTEAYETINSLENALSQERTNLALLNEEKNSAEVGRTKLEDELKKLREEVGSEAGRFRDAEATISSLEEELSTAQNNISALVSEKNVAQQEILTLSSRLSACTEELVGTRGTSESRFQELFEILNSLQLLVEDDALLSSFKKSYQRKFESVKDMDHLLRAIRNQLGDKDSELQQNLNIAEVESYWSKILDETNSLGSDAMDSAEANDLASNFKKTVAELHLKNKTLAGKVEALSTSMDDLIAFSLKELQDIRDHTTIMNECMKSMKQDLMNMEVDKEEHEKAITISRNDVELLVSACSCATQELQLEFEKKLPELDSIADLVGKVHDFSIEKSDSCDDTKERQKRVTSSQYDEMIEQFFSSVKNSRALIIQFENLSKASVTIIEDLRKKLLEAQKASNRALEERNLSQYRVFKLESDVEALQNSCTSMEHKLDDYQVRENEMKAREAEVSSLYSSLSKQNEAGGHLLSESQRQMLFDKVNAIKIHITSSEVGNQELQDSNHAKRLFYIVDTYPELCHQINVLSHEIEELQLNMQEQVAENNQVKQEVEASGRNKQELEKFKSDLLEIALGVDKLIQRLGGGNVVGEKRSPHAGELLSALERLITSTILECEDSKSENQALTAKLSESQKLVDELSFKIRLLEDSVQGMAATAETVQERRIYEAPSMPSGSEISEIEDVGSVGHSGIPIAPSAAHARTMRKGSSDHLALNIDLESDRLIETENTDEDKGHLFKSINTTGLVPKQGKMFADRIDGIWVSGGRVLMSRPRARLGLLAYWIVLHLWLLGSLL